MLETSRIEINLAAVSHNLRLMKRIVGSACGLCPIVKADAYGLGAIRTARTLVAAGADMLAVFTPGQARELFAANLPGPVLVLMPVREIDRTDALYRQLICGRLHLTVHDGEHLEELVRMAERFGATIPLHLEVDTGMSRGGCSLTEAPQMLRRIAEHRRLTLAGMFTHFADPESDMDMTDAQLASFDALLEENAKLIPSEAHVHVASTFAALRAPRFHKSMIRIGLAWMGYGIEALEGGEVITEGEELIPAVTWISRITQMKTIPAGMTVGYGATWRADRESVIGVVPVGYADGYPMNLGAMDNPDETEHPKAQGLQSLGANGQIAVLIRHNGETRRINAPVVGAVNMDQITIDLTDAVSDARHLGATIGIDQEVELITPDAAAPNHLPRLAELGGTFAHEMLCRLNPRLPRVYVNRPVHPERAASEARPAKANSAARTAGGKLPVST
jgi:alanine racemase